MSGDASIVALAAAAWCGALWAGPVPRWAGIAVVVVAFLWRRPVLLVTGVLLLAASLGAASADGLAPAPRGLYAGDVVLVGDPVPVRGGGVRVDVRAAGRRYEAVGRGAAARALAARSSGDVVRLRGRIEPRAPGADWLAVRHVVGRLQVTQVDGWRSGAPVARVANAVRRSLARGADALPAGQRPLYTGLVFGDDRGQSATTVDDLRAAGLGHLLAVSGQNVAVVLGAARPLLERCRYRVRFPLTLAFLVLLVLVTRAEPSILRAAAMSGVVALAAALGRSSSSVRVLALAVTVLVLVDPLLVHALGFQLSVAASAGIVMLATPIAARLPLPVGLADAVGVTLAAQLAVAPIAVSAFGGVPVAALPANLLAAPVAAPVMIWGATVGVVAGMVGGPVAVVLQTPVRLMLWWIEGVGAIAGRLPLGELGWWHVALVAAGGAVASAPADRIRRTVRVAAMTVALVALVEPAWALRTKEFAGAAVAPGVTLWREGPATIVVLDASADARRALEALRRAGVRRLDLVVARSGGVGVSEVVQALSHRYRIGACWASGRHQIRGATTPTPGAAARVGPFVVTVESVGSPLEARIERPP